MAEKINTKRYLTEILKIAFSFAFMFLILYYFFGQNPDRMKEDLLTRVDYKFVALSMIFGALAYVSRGLRWMVLIEAIGHKSSKVNSISAVSIGYFTNLFLPRAGEITRCTSLSKSDKIPVDKLFGTILIERVIDFALLIFLVVLTIILKFRETTNSYDLYQDLPAADSTLKYIVFSIIALIFALLFLFRKMIRRTAFYEKVKNFIRGIKEGFESIKRMKRKLVFWIHTAIIWIMYFLMTYICFYCQ